MQQYSVNYNNSIFASSSTFTSQPECIDYNLKYMRSVLDQTGRYGFELKKNQLAI